MISLNVVFWGLVFLFGLIGATRGWGKEILVSFSVILAIFIASVLELFLPVIKTLVQSGDVTTVFWIRVGLLWLLVFFGYQAPNIPRIAATNRFARERLQDILLGACIGGINGYLVFGTFWYYLAVAKYPFNMVIPPVAGTPAGDAALQLFTILPPAWLGVPMVYFAVAIAFVFVLVVFI